MTTNNDFTIPISQTDRRNVFFKASSTYKQNSEYFNKLSSIFKKENIARAFYEYLLNYKISDGEWDEDEGLQKLRPITEFYKETKMMNLPFIYRFLSSLCYYNKYCNEDDGYITDTDIMIKSNKLYFIYDNWFKECNFNTKVSSLVKFGKDLTNIKIIEKKRKNDGDYYYVNKNELLEYLQTNNLFDEFV